MEEPGNKNTLRTLATLVLLIPFMFLIFKGYEKITTHPEMFFLVVPYVGAFVWAVIFLKNFRK